MTLLRPACQKPASPIQSDMAPHHLDLESLVLRMFNISSKVVTVMTQLTG